MSTVTDTTSVNFSPASQLSVASALEKSAVRSENVVKLQGAVADDTKSQAAQSTQKTLADIRQEDADKKGSDDLLVPDELQAVVKNLNDFVQNIQRDISFNVDESTGGVVVKVKNAGTDEVIRQIPSEEVLALRERLKNDANNVTGLVLSARV